MPVEPSFQHVSERPQSTQIHKQVRTVGRNELEFSGGELAAATFLAGEDSEGRLKQYCHHEHLTKLYSKTYGPV